MSATTTDNVTQISEEAPKTRSLWSNAFRRLIRNRMSLFSLFIVILVLLLAIFGPALSPYDYTKQDIFNTSQPPTAEHLLGTDELGRDILSRLMWGARTALAVALISQGISYSVGAILGAIAAYSGGWIDSLIMRLADIFMSFPHLLLAVFVSATVRRPIADAAYEIYRDTGVEIFRNTVMLDYLIVFGALALASWPWAARLIRGQILSLRENDYVLASRAFGATPWQIIRWHLMPNAIGAIIVAFTAGFGGAMLAESSLSYLGVGIRPPGASWGTMINESLVGWRMHPHLVAMPGIVLAVCVFAFNMFGDGLNDALNPRSSKG
ncbi:MAG: peptide ABC transporter [Anaerolineaceae bacterium]|nr:peptide ABC transporter [Anaerolineaceae bacterium]